MTEMLTAALRLAELDRPVFPCVPGAKVPLYRNPHPKGSPERTTCRGECGRWGHGVLDATTDQAVITTWWTRTPTANIGLATGRPGPDVVDVDTAHGKPGLASYGRLCEAGLLRGAFAVVTTPSGGWHLYFPGTGQGNSVRARHGIDFRGVGGYVLAPPSIVDNRAYRVTERRAPTGVTVDWAAIRDFLDPPRPPRQQPTSQRVSDRFDALVDHVAGQHDGNRNSALYWAACRAAERDADDQVFAALVTAATSTGLAERSAQNTVDSARKRIRSSR